MTIPTIVLLLAGGVVTDRFDRRRVMLAADLIRGVAVGTLAVLALTDSLEIWQIVALSAVYGAGTAFFGPAFDAIVPQILAEDELAQANALDQLVRPIAFRLIGPALGGWLVASIGAGSAFALDAASFIVSAVAVQFARTAARGADVGRLGGGRDPRGLPLRAGARLALGHAAGGGDRLPRVHGPRRGPAAVPRQERAARGCRRARPRVRCGRHRRDPERAGGRTARPPAARHHLDVPRVDDRDRRGRRLRRRPVGVAADARLLRVQRARDCRHDRVGDREATARSGVDARSRLEPRLAHLDRPRAGVTGPHRRRSPVRSALVRRSSGPAWSERPSRSRRCSCPGCARSSPGAARHLRWSGSGTTVRPTSARLPRSSPVRRARGTPGPAPCGRPGRARGPS